MKAFRIGPVLCQCTGPLWLVTRDTYLRTALTEAEAERFARQMATEHGAPLDASTRIDVTVQPPEPCADWREDFVSLFDL